MASKRSEIFERGNSYSGAYQAPDRRRVLPLAIAAALGLAFPSLGIAQFPAEIDLAVLESGVDTTSGIVFFGATERNYAGQSVSAAGDINGDGIDDLIIGAFGANPNGNDSGRSYVVFGNAGGLTNPFELSSINGLNGFVLSGEAEGDQSGRAVSAAGDINVDGIDDLIIGAFGVDPNGSYSGRSYVVFGSDSGFPSPFNLSTINGLNGFVLNGEAAGDSSGRSVSAAGDINGDGIDDLIIGADGADPNGSSSGQSYVVFGSDIGLSSPFELSSINGLNGFVLNGEAANDVSGASVTGAGDINGDGIDDLVIGASFADPNGSSSGRSYVVFGSDIGLPNPFELSSINGLNGFVLNGEAANDLSGASVSGAGDINGDGIDDLVIGASFADPNGSSSGRSYVVFGSDIGLPNPFELSSINGLNGFVLNGEAANDLSGASVTGAGDINGDGIDDLVIGAPSADPNGSSSGRSYVVFGSGSGLPNPLNLSNLDGANGFRISGAVVESGLGFSVSAAGDINGDGVSDVIIGAPALNNDATPGRSYVIFGRSGLFRDRFESD